MKLSRKQGATSQILQLFIQDSNSINGVGLSGLTNITPNLVAYYNKDTSPSPIQVPLATMTCGTYTASGFKEINAGKMQGWYQFCPPDACFVSGCSLGIHLAGAANMVPLPLEIDLAGYAKADVVSWSGTVLTPPTTPGLPDINLKNILGTQSSGTGGFVGIDWNNIANKSVTIDFPNTSISGIQVYTGNVKQTGDSYTRIGNAGINLTSVIASSLLGNTPQTGDSYLRLGNGGINLTSVVASSVLGNIGGNVLGNLNGNVLGYVNVSGIQSVVASGLANTILSQSMKCVENTAGSGTLCEIVLQNTNSSIGSTTMHIKRSDGSDFSTKILVLEGGANPIRAIS